jgi:ankyrin repeat protein
MKKVLLEPNCSNVNTTCFYGWNALMYAVQNYTPGTEPLEGAPHLRNYQCVIELLMQKIDLHAVDSGGRTILDHALSKKNCSLVAQLKTAGVCVQNKN